VVFLTKKYKTVQVVYFYLRSMTRKGASVVMSCKQQVDVKIYAKFLAKKLG
jgi:citrate lyase synthetase